MCTCCVLLVCVISLKISCRSKLLFWLLITFCTCLETSLILFEIFTSLSSPTFPLLWYLQILTVFILWYAQCTQHVTSKHVFLHFCLFVCFVFWAVYVKVFGNVFCCCCCSNIECILSLSDLWRKGCSIQFIFNFLKQTCLWLFH